MSTVICATRKVTLDPVTLNKVMQNCDGTVFTIFNTYHNFDDKYVINRPVSFLANTIIHGVVDKVIQIGYDGIKHELVLEAEASGVDVILYRSMD